MRRRHGLVPIILLGLALAACGKKAEPVLQPPTEAGPQSEGMTTARPTPTPVTPVDPTAAAAAVTRGLVAEVGEVIHFDLDQDVIRPEDRPILDRKAAILGVNPSLRIRVSGHADERGSDEYNLVLGNKRALAAKNYFLAKGVSASRIDVTSYGEERPMATGSDEPSWAQNRRAEFEIIGGGERLVAPR
jgi:peptidoglycan-associated lipoprotein